MSKQEQMFERWAKGLDTRERALANPVRNWEDSGVKEEIPQATNEPEAKERKPESPVKQVRS